MPVEDDFTGCRAAFLTRAAGSGVRSERNKNEEKNFKRKKRH
jgi:hypothetical protein